MRAVLLLLLVALCSLASAQMTFTDHWSKKNAQRPVPVQSKRQSEHNLASPWCRDDEFYEQSLEWLRRQTEIVQRQMEACRNERGQ